MNPYDRRRNQWKKIRDCIEGQDEIKANTTAYLPKPDGMTPPNYQAYVERAQFFGVAERTLRGLVGAALRREPVIALPDRLEPMRKRATNDKAPMPVLIEDMLREVLSVGRIGLLLDFPRANTTSTTLPHIVPWMAESIESTKTAYVDGELELTSVVLAENTDDDADIFMELCLDPVYTIRRFTLEGNEKARVQIEDDIIPTVNGKPLNFIPFLCVSAYNLRPDEEKPPLLDLCDVNLSHYKNSADREHAMYLTATPTPWIAGNVPADKIPKAIGSGTVWNLPEGTQVGMLEFQGPSMTAFKELMEEKTEQMAALGARMIQDGKNRNETSDTARMRGRSELSLLASSVTMCEAALEHMLRLAADWTGANPDEVDVTFNRDFVETRMEPNELIAVMKAWQSGLMSHRTAHGILQRGELVPADRSYEDERDQIEEEGGDLSMIIPQLKTVA